MNFICPVKDIEAMEIEVLIFYDKGTIQNMV